MDTAFRDFDILTLYRNGSQVGQLDVYMGQAETVGAILREDVIAGFARVDRDEISARIDYQMVPAPIAEGDKVGELIILQSGEETARYPLYAAESVARKGFFGRVGASLVSKIRG
ncbi:MAG: hypothetical protein AAFP97_09735 [Pseudomonadota bacterium]